MISFIIIPILTILFVIYITNIITFSTNNEINIILLIMLIIGILLLTSILPYSLNSLFKKSPLIKRLKHKPMLVILYVLSLLISLLGISLIINGILYSFNIISILCATIFLIIFIFMNYYVFIKNNKKDYIAIKKNGFLNALIVFIFVLTSLVLLFFLTKYAIKYFSDSDTSTTTTNITLSNMNNRVANYLNDVSRVRKFENKERILLILPSNYDLVDNKNYYLEINRNDNGLLNTHYGTYTLKNNTLTIDENQEQFSITEGGISSTTGFLNIFDSEYKYYYFNDNVESYLLIINSTLKSEVGLFLSSSKDGTKVITSSFVENQTSITFNSKEVFIKSGMNVSINNRELVLVS